MTNLAEIERILKEQKPHLEDEYGITEVGVFGSYVRGEQGPDSDVDVLISLENPPRVDLFDLVELEDRLSELLGIKADIAIKANLRRRIGQRILNEVVLV